MIMELDIVAAEEDCRKLLTVTRLVLPLTCSCVLPQNPGDE